MARGSRVSKDVAKEDEMVEEAEGYVSQWKGN